MASSGGKKGKPDRSDVHPFNTPVGASPFTYTNTNRYEIDVLFSGGNVSSVEFSRDGNLWFSASSFAGFISLSIGEKLKISHLVAPTMTIIPR